MLGYIYKSSVIIWFTLKSIQNSLPSFPLAVLLIFESLILQNAEPSCYQWLQHSFTTCWKPEMNWRSVSRFLVISWNLPMPKILWVYPEICIHMSFLFNLLTINAFYFCYSCRVASIHSFLHLWVIINVSHCS